MWTFIRNMRRNLQLTMCSDEPKLKKYSVFGDILNLILCTQRGLFFILYRNRMRDKDDGRDEHKPHSTRLLVHPQPPPCGLPGYGHHIRQVLASTGLGRHAHHYLCRGRRGATPSSLHDRQYPIYIQNRHLLWADRGGRKFVEILKMGYSQYQYLLPSLHR